MTDTGNRLFAMPDSARSAGARLLRGTDGRVRATWRIILGFVVFFSVSLLGRRLLTPLSFPDVAVNGPIVPVFAVACVAVLAVGSRVDRRRVRDYGLDLDRRWWLDFSAAVVTGVLFQGLVTGLSLWTGTGRIVGRFSPGVTEGTGTGGLVVAVVATVLAFLAIGFWEELLFRAVFVRNAVEGLIGRGAAPRTAVGIAVVVSAIVFGIVHARAPPDGSTAFAVLQATVAGVYFALAYVLTDSLAFPVGLHFSTNLWTASVIGIPGSGFPALVRMERTFGVGPHLLATFVVPVAALVGIVVAYASLTRGGLDFSLDTAREGSSSTARRGDLTDAD
jgi:membrane protease YdiL (CAAX protease family)